MLIPYAGYDALEAASPKVRRSSKALRAYELSDLGWDTGRIARVMKIKEREAAAYVAQYRRNQEQAA